MHALIEHLIERGPVITDGAWGTELQARGLGLGEFPDVWNLLHPDLVHAVAQAYVEAGSRVILTNTFGANRIRLSGHDLDERVAEINRRGVEISKAAAGTRASVFASIGPSGRLLVADEVTAGDLKTAFEEQASVLAKAGADALVVETMADVDEARIAVQAAKSTGLPVVACMVFDSGREKDRTSMGVTIEQAVAKLSEAGADILGANCGQGIQGFVPIAQRLRKATSLPVWIKANAGLPELINGRAVYRTTPEDFVDYASPLLAAGANFLGGCCGTNPQFVRALSKKCAPSSR